MWTSAKNLDVYRRLMIVAALIACLVPSAVARAVPVADGPDRGAILGVIQSQLDAFLRDDGVAAFSYASPRIREKFGSPENFMTMVRVGYPAVYRPRDIEFMAIQQRDDLIFQPVRFVGADGESVIALYEMQRQADGTWKINGVYMIRTGEMTS